MPGAVDVASLTGHAYALLCSLQQFPHCVMYDSGTPFPLASLITGQMLPLCQLLQFAMLIYVFICLNVDQEQASAVNFYDSH